MEQDKPSRPPREGAPEILMKRIKSKIMNTQTANQNHEYDVPSRPVLEQPQPDLYDLGAYNFNPVVLREYDIRGIIGEQLDSQDAYMLGAAFGTYLRKISGKGANDLLWVTVGFDGRLSSPKLEHALVSGLMKVGINVERLGLGPTPMTYFAAMDHLSDGAIMVTGSHNPSDYNGFKMVLQGGAVYGQTIQDLGKIAAEDLFYRAEEAGQFKDTDVRDTYVKRLLKDYEGERSLKVVWDAGNGAAGDVLRMLVAQLPGEHILLYDTIDGTFPNHHPDPTVDANLADLKQAVADHKADLGIAFDGDADRIGAVDNEGTVLRCDTLMMIYARDVLADYPEAPIIADVKCSQSLFAHIRELGGQPVMARTGHSLVKAKMAELKAPLAGELSGHIFFADKYYGFDDALYCGIRLMNEVASSEQPLSEVLAQFPPQYSTPEIRIDVDEAIKFALVDKIKEIASGLAEGEDGADLIDIDGVRYQNDKGWWLIRASNTQNCLVARVEAYSADDLAALREVLGDVLANVDVTIPH